MNFERGQDPKKAMRIGKDREIKQGDRFYVFDHLTSTLVEVEALDDEMLSEELFPDRWIKNINSAYTNTYTAICHYVPIRVKRPDGNYEYMPAKKKREEEWRIGFLTNF